MSTFLMLAHTSPSILSQSLYNIITILHWNAVIIPKLGEAYIVILFSEDYNMLLHQNMIQDKYS